jgi:uncharacterized protein (DUF58 family)
MKAIVSRSIRFMQGLTSFYEDKNRIVLLYSLIYLLIILSISHRQGELLLISIPLILIIGAKELAGTDKTCMEVEWDQEVYRTINGNPVRIRCRVKNLGQAIREMKLAVSLPENLQKIEGITSLICPLGQGDTEYLDFIVTGVCGTYELKGIAISIHGFLGFCNQQEIVGTQVNVLILPGASSKKGLVLQPHRVKQQQGVNLSRQGGDGIEVFGIREYKPGDPLRKINGRASARHPRSLFIQEFELEKVTNVLLLLDTHGRAMSLNGSDNLLYHSLEVTSILSETLLNSGNRLGLFVFGNYHSWVFPGSGKLQKEKVLRALAFNPESPSTWDTGLDNLPPRFLAPRSFIIMISPMLRANTGMLFSLKGHRHQVMVISPDEIGQLSKNTGDDEALQLAYRMANLERNLVLRKLSDNNIPVLNWQIDTPFESLINRFLGTYRQ